MPSVFISHSKRDNLCAKKIKDRLSAKGIRVWFDEDELKPGDSILSSIENGLKRVDHLVVLLSDSSVRSEWVKVEIEAAFLKKIIIPIYLPCLKNKEEVPLTLRRIKRISCDGNSNKCDEVVTGIMDSILRNYEDTNKYKIEIKSPEFPPNCELSWFDQVIKDWLKNSSTGVSGDNSPNDKQYRIICTTDAPDNCDTNVEVKVEGTGEKIWSQESDKTEKGQFMGRIYLRDGEKQNTTILVSIYEPVGEGSILASRRIFKINKP